jgi:hypothetical protein
MNTQTRRQDPVRIALQNAEFLLKSASMANNRRASLSQADSSPTMDRPAAP